MTASRGLALLTGALAVFAHAEPPRIVLVGDSTVTDSAGWGPGFKARLNGGVEYLNHAKSGRSSKSYRNEGHWTQALAARPTHVLIQFGHNDCPGKGPERETDPQTTFRGYMVQYVEEARAAGAQPILVTSLVRRTFTKEGKLTSILTPYADAVKSIGVEMGVAVIDLHALTFALCERLGPTGSKPLGYASSPGGWDNTHLSEQGAGVVGEIVARELARLVPELRPYLPRMEINQESPK